MFFEIFKSTFATHKNWFKWFNFEVLITRNNDVVKKRFNFTTFTSFFQFTKKLHLIFLSISPKIWKETPQKILTSTQTWHRFETRINICLVLWGKFLCKLNFNNGNVLSVFRVSKLTRIIIKYSVTCINFRDKKFHHRYWHWIRAGVWSLATKTGSRWKEKPIQVSKNEEN